jgi:hypothetical protein
MGGEDEGGDHAEVEGEGEREDRRRNQVFSYMFCLMMEGSGSGSGSIPLTNGSSGGSGTHCCKASRGLVTV